MRSLFYLETNLILPNHFLSVLIHIKLDTSLDDFSYFINSFIACKIKSSFFINNIY